MIAELDYCIDLVKGVSIRNPVLIDTGSGFAYILSEVDVLHEDGLLDLSSYRSKENIMLPRLKISLSKMLKTVP